MTKNNNLVNAIFKKIEKDEQERLNYVRERIKEVVLSEYLSGNCKDLDKIRDNEYQISFADEEQYSEESLKEYMSILGCIEIAEISDYLFEFKLSIVSNPLLEKLIEEIVEEIKKFYETLQNLAIDASNNFLEHIERGYFDYTVLERIGTKIKKVKLKVIMDFNFYDVSNTSFEDRIRKFLAEKEFKFEAFYIEYIPNELEKSIWYVVIGK